MNSLNISIRPYDVWNFSSLDERYGYKYPGQIPADIVFNTFFFINQGDLVVDPMAGSGVVGEICNQLKSQFMR
jgi:hypothetical protein